MATTNSVMPVRLIADTFTTRSISNPGTTSGGRLSAAVTGLKAHDLADPELVIVLRVQLQFHPGGDFEGQPGAEVRWQGGPGVTAGPSIAWTDPYYRCARIVGEVSKPVSLGATITTPN